jgi:nucleoid-associated protein YgaU
MGQRMTFFRGSRYEKVGEVESTDGQGRPIRYKRTRFIADPPLQGTHVTTDGDRLDRLAFRVYGDVERWWLIADANVAMWPADLLSEPGRVIAVPRGQS